jgi:hypothetical protein
MYKESSTAAGGTEVASKFHVSASSTQSTVWSDPGTSLSIHSDTAAGAVKSGSAVNLVCLCCLQAPMM